MAALVCLVAMGMGLETVRRGGLTYRNYEGLSVFAPFAILIGAVGLYVVLWKWKPWKPF